MTHVLSALLTNTGLLLARDRAKPAASSQSATKPRVSKANKITKRFSQGKRVYLFGLSFITILV